MKKLITLSCVFLMATLLFAQDDGRGFKSKSHKRVALLIGNAAYNGHADLGQNPINDAKDLGAALESLDFHVTVLTDVDESEFENGIRSFQKRSKQAKVALFFFAGHGMQVNKENYILPIKVDIRDADDLDYECISVSDIQRKMESDNPDRLNLIVLDACRNNPYRSWQRGGESGLATMKPPSGTLIAYSTAPGSVAANGDGRNGLYTSELIRQIQRPQRVIDVFMNTRMEVLKKSNKAQRPWEDFSLTGKFYLTSNVSKNREENNLAKSIVLPTKLENNSIVFEQDISDLFGYYNGVYIYKHKNGYMGIVNENGSKITEPIFSRMGRFNENYAVVALKKKYGYINTNGKIITQFLYDDAHPFSEGRAAVKLKGKWGYIDTNGNLITEIKYDYVERYSEGLAVIKLNNKYGFVNINGKETLSPKYKSLGPLNEGLSSFRKRSKYGYVNRNGQIVIPAKFDDNRKFSCGLAAVILDDKYGFIDKTGCQIISNNFDAAWPFVEDIARVKIGDKFGYIDKKGNQITSCKYSVAFDFKEGYACISDSGKWGLINKKGQPITPLIYDNIWNFFDGKAMVSKGEYWGCIDYSGKVIIPIIYDSCGKPGQGSVTVKRNGIWRIIKI